MAPLGVYVHVPFCAQRCDYCAFAIWTDRTHLVESYVEAVLAEIDAARRSGALVPATTLYVGGGTPSVVAPELLARLIERIERLPGAEVTVECNPESTSPELLSALRGVGVTRISLGVQSFSPTALAGLGRPHGPDEARRAVALVGAAGFSTFNVDLVYGAAGEDAESWDATLAAVLALEPAPPHISAYALTVEAGTPLAADPLRHPDDDVLAERYARLDEVLGEAGYRWYEISNFALPGHECAHNASAWEEGNYLGFGCAAHSHVDGLRFENVRHVDRYLERISTGRSPVARSEQVAGERRTLEALELSLRTRNGVPAANLDTTGIEHLVVVSGGRVVLNAAGRMLADEVAMRLRG